MYINCNDNEVYGTQHTYILGFHAFTQYNTESKQASQIAHVYVNIQTQK